MAVVVKSVDDKDRPSAVGKKLPRGSGRQTVNYRDANGKRQDAVVISKGSVSGLKLFVKSRNLVVDNVAARTTVKGTGYYDVRS